MPRSPLARLPLLGPLLCLPLLLLAGCPEARPPVDRTQAGVLEKAGFDGEWYFQRTVVDAPYDAAFTFIGDQGELERIRWRIEEDLLIAVRAYERIEGADRELGPDGEDLGHPVAAWPIESHFDIRREYNSTTGEEYNVLVENADDRPWFEREFFRVDWSQNVISNWNFYVPESVELAPLAWDTNDPEHPWAPVVEDDYFEITNSFFAQPGTFVDPMYPEDGAWPICWLYYQFDDCTASEIVVRNSFLKVGERNYEPAAWTGIDMELFGYFDRQIIGYDENYGPTNTGRQRWQVRWNIWEQSHDNRSCEADEACSDVVGSTCDEANGLCTLPFRERPTRDIVYYASPDMDPLYQEVNHEIVAQWNEAFRDTVNTLRYYECLDDGGGPASCQEAVDEELAVFHFCPHNPVAEGDPAVCGEVGLAPRLGDLRYNFLYNVESASLGEPFGFGPAQADPLTGEIVNAQAIVYEAEVDWYSAWGRDLVLLLNGDITESEFIEGEDVSAWVASRLEAEQPTREGLTPEEVHEHASHVQLAHRHTLPDLTPPAAEGGHPRGRVVPRERLDALREARRALRQHPAVSADHSTHEARLSALIGSDLETLTLTEEAVLMAERLPGGGTNEALLERASPLRRLQDQRHRRARRARMQANSKRCVYHREFVDPSVEGRAASYVGWDPEEIRIDLARGIYRGVMAHEMGHTLGLRHNLEGSADPMNYGADYWALRDDGSMGPRYTDPETRAEIDGSIRENQYSSIMDYLSRFNSDHHGVQAYDRAAIKFGYGRVMEVLTDDADGEIANFVYLYQLLGWPTPLLYDEQDRLAGLHYTDFPLYFGDLSARRDVPQRLLSDTYETASFFESPHTYLATAEGEPVVPYRFCSDEFVGSSLMCHYFDEGADLYEIATDFTHRYEQWYLLNNFGRDRLYFSPDGYDWRIWDRYFDPMVGLNQWWVLFSEDLYATSEPTDDIPFFLERADGFGPLTLGVREIFNTLARTIARPEPGGYALTERPDGSEYWEPLWWAEDLTLGLDVGRYPDTSWDYEEGYFWDEVVSRIGYTTDKVLAMEALFDPTTYFLGQDTASDLRGYRVNFASNFNDQLNDIVGDLMSGQTDSFGPYEAGMAVRFPDYADPERRLPANGTPVDPAAGFTIQFHTALLGLTYLPDSFESQLIDSSRLWLAGASDAIETVRDTVEHTDPGSGLTWRAVSYPGLDGEQEGIAARMIERANLLSLLLEDPTLTPQQEARLDQELYLQRENLNLLRAIHRELGSLDFAL